MNIPELPIQVVGIQDREQTELSQALSIQVRLSLYPSGGIQDREQTELSQALSIQVRLSLYPSGGIQDREQTELSQALSIQVRLSLMPCSRILDKDIRRFLNSARLLNGQYCEMFLLYAF
jgi:hypothetical protein